MALRRNGHGSALLLLGGNVLGGQVHGQWPGLAEGQLVGPGDLAVTTDYRDVLADSGGPIARLTCGETSVLGERWFEAGAQLRDDLRAGSWPRRVWGAVDGSGTDRSWPPLPTTRSSEPSRSLPTSSRRTRAMVTSTPQRSQMTSLYLMRLYLPQAHS